MSRYSFSWFIFQIVWFYSYVYLFHNLLDRKRSDIKSTVLVCFTLCFFQVLIPKLIASDLICMLLYTILFCLIFRFIKKCSIKTLVLLFILFNCLANLSSLSAMLVFQGLDSLFGGIEESYILFLYGFTSLFASYILVKIFARKNENDISLKNLFIFVILVLNQIFWLDWFANTINSQYVNVSSLYFLITLDLVIGIILIFIIRDYLTKKKEKYRLTLLQENNELMKQQLTQLADKQSILNKAYQYIQDKELSINNLDDINNSLRDIRINNYCDNVSINALLNSFIQQCNSEDIKFDISIKGSLKDKLHDYDLNILLTNIIKNSIENSNGYIDLRILSTDTNILIKCENSNDNKVKQDKLIHGIGMKIINNIVNKYNGNYSFNIKDNIAYLNIMLSLE